MLRGMMFMAHRAGEKRCRQRTAVTKEKDEPKRVVGHYGGHTAQGADVMSKWFVRAALPVILSIFAFILVEYLNGSRRREPTAPDPMLNQLVQAVTVRDVPLQVAIHDLIESAPAGTAIRVCRSLADRPVSLQVAGPQPLHAVLERLAAQLGTTPALASTRRRGDRVLPTLPCPDGSGDYLVIGSQAPLGR